MFKFIRRHWHRRWERIYLRHPRHLIFDLIFLLIIIILAAALVIMHFYRPATDIKIPAGQTSDFPKVSVDLDNPPLEMTISSPEDSPALADGLDLKISLVNNGSIELDKIKISFFSADNNFSISRLQTASEGIDISGKSLSISAPLAPAEKREFDLNISATRKDSSSRLANFQARLEYEAAGQPVEQIVTLDSWILPADLKVLSDVYYTSPQGDQLGVGPLPPVAGLPTNYWVSWRLNTDGDLKDAVVVGRLPKGVELTGSYSLLSGEFSYNSDSRQVVWKIGELAAEADTGSLNFEIQFLPDKNQVGTTPKLLTNLRYRAIDALRNKEISGNLLDEDASLPDDKFNEGRGEVIGQ